MTTKIISSYYAGYTLAATYSALSITSAGDIGAPGLTLTAAARVTNAGRIFGTIAVTASGGPATISNLSEIEGGYKGLGVEMGDGGTLTNGAANDTSAIIYAMGSGVSADASSTVINFGRIAGYGYDGVNLQAGGAVTNGSATDFVAEIIGADTAVQGGAQSVNVTNFRLIEANGTAVAAVSLTGGGRVTNGASNDTTALIQAYFAGVDASVASTLINFGTILASKQQAVSFSSAGLVVNGTTADTHALIEGATQGVNLGSGVGTLLNFGSIKATAKGSGVLFGSGAVTNGSTTSTAALIEGVYHGVAATAAGANVVNFGIIDAVGGVGSTNPVGISLKAGGAITNGATNDVTATIETGAGGLGIVSVGAAKISNFGTVLAPEDTVYLGAGGLLANGSASDANALLFGGGGVTIGGGAGTVTNFGSIIAYDTEAGGVEGVLLQSSGIVTNGSAADTHALIAGGGDGLAVSGAATVTNFGTIERLLSGAYGMGVSVEGGRVSNGSSADQTALISGGTGVEIGSSSPATVTNFGTIRGEGGTAVAFGSSTDVLNVEAGSALVGVSALDGGTLNLASGTGTLSGFSSAGNVTVSGSMAAAAFRDIGALKIAAGAHFTDTGLVSLGAGRTLINAGTLALGGGGINSIVNAGQIITSGGLMLAGLVKNSGVITVAGGSLAVSGSVTGAGSVTINGGTASFASTFSENVAFTSTGGTLALSHARTYAGSISGFAKTAVSVLNLGDITFASGTTKASYSGTTSSGVLTVTDGTNTAHIKLIGNYTLSTFIASSDGHGGTKVVDPTMPAGPSAATLAEAMAGMGAAHTSAPHLARWEAVEVLRPLAGTRVHLQ